MIAIRILDLGSRILVADSRPPDDVDPLRLQILDGLLHIVDFERYHAVPQMFLLGGGLDGSALIRDEFDDCAAQVPVTQVHWPTQRTALGPDFEIEVEP